MADKMTVIVLPAQDEPYVAHIENTLEEFQRLVGGYIEVVQNARPSEYIKICNEEGLILGLPKNRWLPTLVGNIVICREYGEEFYGLDETFAEVYVDTIKLIHI